MVRSPVTRRASPNSPHTSRGDPSFVQTLKSPEFADIGEKLIVGSTATALFLMEQGEPIHRQPRDIDLILPWSRLTSWRGSPKGMYDLPGWTLGPRPNSTNVMSGHSDSGLCKLDLIPDVNKILLDGSTPNAEDWIRSTIFNDIVFASPKLVLDHLRLPRISQGVGKASTRLYDLAVLSKLVRNDREKASTSRRFTGLRHA